MIEDKHKIRKSFILISATRRILHLISTKWEPQSEENKYIEALR